MAGATDSSAGRKKSGGFLIFLRDIAVIVVFALVLSFVLKTFFVRAFYIPSGSMQQTLQVNDRILVNQLVPNLQDIRRGDIVVFEDPGGWVHPAAFTESGVLQDLLEAVGLAADSAHEYVVKRVIGIGGDHVVCCDANGQVVINNVSVDEPYIVLPEGETRASGIDFDVTVPEGAVWVMGDNRYASKDSRYNQEQPGNGFVPEDTVVGRAFFLNWPVHRWQLLSTQSEVFEEVERETATVTP